MQTTHRKSLIALSLLLVAALSACSGRRDETRNEVSAASTREASQTITVKGSDTMVILAQKWAEAHMAKNPGATIQVSGGGSGTGIAALINGTTDLANASRPMKDKEKKQIKATRGAEPVEFRVAIDALAVYVHKDNALQSISLEQLNKIYRGELTNWKDLGGPDAKIVLYGRENNSGTYAYFKEHVLDDLDFAPTTQTLPGTAAVINAVTRDNSGIGYGGIAYAEGVRRVPVIGKDGQPVEPNMENAISGAYPLSRFLNVYSIGAPTGLAKSYLDFTLSAEGQKLVEGVGYYPLPDKK